MLVDRVVRFLFPRQDHFFTLLEELGNRIEAAAAIFGELVTANGRDALESIAARLKPVETEADKICHRVFEELDRTFVTPIDREDIAALTKALDNVIDEMEHSSSIAALYRFESLSEPMRLIIGVTVKAALELGKAVTMLRRFSDPSSIRETTIAIHTLENEADQIFRSAVAGLFSNGIGAIDLVRQKDMLESLENGVDRCEDAMDVIRSVIVKNG